MNDSEEIDRLIKSISHCRTCDHVRIAHKVLGKKEVCLDATLTNKEAYKSCLCKEFLPSDNLEYLEWIAEKKKKNETV